MNKRKLQIAIIGSVMLAVAVCLVSLIYPVASHTSIFKDLIISIFPQNHLISRIN